MIKNNKIKIELLKELQAHLLDEAVQEEFEYSVWYQAGDLDEYINNKIQELSDK